MFIVKEKENKINIISILLLITIGITLWWLIDGSFYILPIGAILALFVTAINMREFSNISQELKTPYTDTLFLISGIYISMFFLSDYHNLTGFTPFYALMILLASIIGKIFLLDKLIDTIFSELRKFAIYIANFIRFNYLVTLRVIIAGIATVLLFVNIEYYFISIGMYIFAFYTQLEHIGKRILVVIQKNKRTSWRAANFIFAIIIPFQLSMLQIEWRIVIAILFLLIGFYDIINVTLSNTWIWLGENQILVLRMSSVFLAVIFAIIPNFTIIGIPSRYTLSYIFIILAFVDIIYKYMRLLVIWMNTNRMTAMRVVFIGFAVISLILPTTDVLGLSSKLVGVVFFTSLAFGDYLYRGGTRFYQFVITMVKQILPWFKKWDRLTPIGSIILFIIPQKSMLIYIIITLGFITAFDFYLMRVLDKIVLYISILVSSIFKFLSFIGKGLLNLGLPRLLLNSLKGIARVFGRILRYLLSNITIVIIWIFAVFSLLLGFSLLLPGIFTFSFLSTLYYQGITSVIVAFIMIGVGVMSFRESYYRRDKLRLEVNL